MGDKTLDEQWPVLARHETALRWLQWRTDCGLAPRTIDAYGRGLSEFLLMCEREAIDPLKATREDVGRYVRELAERPAAVGSNVVSIDSGGGLSNATMQQRLVPVRLFFDLLVEDGVRVSNPVGRGRYTPGNTFGHERGMIPRFTKLPWIPADAEWHSILAASMTECCRNRLMLAVAYDSALRREELCSLQSGDIDPAHRTLRVRAETTKSRRERVVPYSASTGVLLGQYLVQRRRVTARRGALFLSESRRNYGEPITLWTWSKVVRKLALTAGVPRFSTHTLRHLCLTDLARSGWDLHAIATFAGHLRTDTTMQYIHLSGRDLSAKLSKGMAQIHAWRIDTLTATADATAVGP